MQGNANNSSVAIIDSTYIYSNRPSPNINMDEIKELTIIVKWCGKEYPVSELTADDTVEMLRHEICKKTQVRPERQKLLNLKLKGNFGFRHKYSAIPIACVYFYI